MDPFALILSVVLAPVALLILLVPSIPITWAIKKLPPHSRLRKILLFSWGKPRSDT